MDILFFMNNKIELLMLQIKAPLDHFIAAFTLDSYHWKNTLYMLFQFLISGTYKKIVYIFFLIFFLDKILSNVHCFSILNNIPLLGFAKQNKTLSISNQNNNDYTYILGGNQIHFLLLLLKRKSFLNHTLPWIRKDCVPNTKHKIFSCAGCMILLSKKIPTNSNRLRFK